MSWKRRLRGGWPIVKSAIRHPLLFVSVVILGTRIDDLERWTPLESVDPDWDERTRLIAGFIPAGSSVIEFGAARLLLPSYLRPDCRYQPSDIVKRSEETIAIDLNGELPRMDDVHDYAVLSGVLEYIRDCDAVLKWLASFNRHIVFSYAIADKLDDPITRVKNGWVNHFYAEDIIELIERAGFKVAQSANWREQVVFVCIGPMAK